MELEPWPDASQGVRRVINVEDWAEIRRLHRAQGMGVKAIARRLGVARNTVRSALRSAGPPSYQRQPKGSIVDAVEPQILELLRDCPDLAATVVAERIGWDRSIRVNLAAGGLFAATAPTVPEVVLQPSKGLTVRVLIELFGARRTVPAPRPLVGVPLQALGRTRCA